ncbi:MAG TPA: AarF/UbiB family protein [Acidimicrobiales bacterium]|nr:AarF/UbiB family protein [Acidimicrobiales bacterium]
MPDSENPHDAAGDGSAPDGAASRGAAPRKPDPADLAFGAFSSHPPWVLDLEAIEWRSGIDERRARTAAEAPRLTRRRRLPPGVRVVRVLTQLGGALGGWYAWDRRRDRGSSRAGLSRRLRRAFERLGPTYIKLGQILSAGEGVFPEELVAEFRLCRDQVPAESFEAVRAIVEADLGMPLDKVFREFDEVPIAAASIAQVHGAVLAGGEPVVVKVQRPDVARLVRRDLAAMSWIAPLLVGRIPVAALANPPALVELFGETIVEELDFRLEAQNMLDVAAVLADTGQTAIVVPRPHPSLVTRRVLVMERLSGFAWGDAPAMQAAGIDTEAVLHAGLIAFLEGALLYGVFHGDLHGGNLFVQPDGRVALLDFGITGRFDELKRRAFLRLVIAASANDIRGQIAAMRDLGALPVDVDVEAVIRDLKLDRPPLDPTTLTAEELTAEIRDITKALLGYGARMPKELMLYVKDMIFLDGAMAVMAPNVDVIGEIVRVVMYFHERHGERIALEIGVEPGAIPAIDVAGIRASFGVTEPVDALTYRELQERREIIRRRFEQRRRGRRRRR